MKSLLWALMALAVHAAAPIPGFRPPAIPFITSDPYTEIYLRGDDAFVPEGTVYWDGSKRNMVGYLRVDGTAYRFVGSRRDDAVEAAPPMLAMPNTDFSFNKCDMKSFAGVTDANRCNELCAAEVDCKAFVINSDTCWLKNCIEDVIDSDTATSYLPYNALDHQSGYDIASYTCDLETIEGWTAERCGLSCAGNDECVSYVFTPGDGKCFLKSCSAPLIATEGREAYIIDKEFHSFLRQSEPALVQKSVTVHPTRTVFELELSGVLEVTLTTLTPFVPKTLELMSRPATIIAVDVKPLDGKEHTVEAYLDVTAENAVNDYSERVQWEKWDNSVALGARIGTVDQNVLGMEGDGININWGWVNLAVAKDQSVGSGYAKDLRDQFVAEGTLPEEFPSGPWRAANDRLPAIAAVHNLGKVNASGARALFAYALDEQYAIYYFGKFLAPLWTRYYTTCADAMADALLSYDDDLALCTKSDEQLLAELEAKVNAEYATIGALAFRQSFAASKLVWNPETEQPEMYLKEISTDGYMNTVDVIYPVSPLLLYTNPKFLEYMIVPVLRYANNETVLPYTNPYSPHELGAYPRANHTTEQQEPMPMENSGNMFLMMQAILQRNGGDTSFFYPHYWPMLMMWADYLDQTLPFPAEQLCTDDFCGRLANNTNLAAKGIVALAVFSDICLTVTGNETLCAPYKEHAIVHAQTWLKYARVDGDLPYTMLTFNDATTWSTKYNLVWQRILGMGNVPFETYDTILKEEIDYYISKFDPYGNPMDSRHDWIKLDWLAWTSVLAIDTEYSNKFLDVIYKYANETPSRMPLCDWYISGTGAAKTTAMFMARPVVGGVFLRMLL